MKDSSFFVAGSFLSLALLLSACSGGDPGDASGGSGGAGTGGGSPSGGASGNGGGSTGGDSSGGSSTGGGETGGHCSPVSASGDGANLYPEPISNCGRPANWTGDEDAGFRNFDLSLFPTLSPSQIGPGDVYSFSTLVGRGRFAVYGATEKCGEVGELLSDVTGDDEGVVCHELRPQTGTYTHLIWVWYGGGFQSTTTFCIDGTCPAR